MTIIFISGYVEIILFQFNEKFTARCIQIVMVCPQTESSDFGSRLRLFLWDSDIPDSTADSFKKMQANVCLFTF